MIDGRQTYNRVQTARAGISAGPISDPAASYLVDDDNGPRTWRVRADRTSRGHVSGRPLHQRHAAHASASHAREECQSADGRDARQATVAPVSASA